MSLKVECVWCALTFRDDRLGVQICRNSTADVCHRVRFLFCSPSGMLERSTCRAISSKCQPFHQDWQTISAVSIPYRCWSLLLIARDSNYSFFWQFRSISAQIISWMKWGDPISAAVIGVTRMNNQDLSLRISLSLQIIYARSFPCTCFLMSTNITTLETLNNLFALVIKSHVCNAAYLIRIKKRHSCEIFMRVYGLDCWLRAGFIIYRIVYTTVVLSLVIFW